MKARMLWWLVVGCGLMVSVCGCVTAVDPVTGEKTVAVDPNSPIVAGGEMVAQGVAAVGPFFGAVGVLIAGIATGVLAAWRKIKPSLTEAKAVAVQYHAAASATVTALESFKATNPVEWGRLGELISEQLTKQKIPPLVVENVIRAIRGLPPKA
jgi:hypothetical protein